MPSIVAQRQTAWFLDPQDEFGNASDTNDGLTQDTPLLTTEEFFRRVGSPMVLAPGQQVTITFLSNLTEQQRFGLEVMGGPGGDGDPGMVILTGLITPEPARSGTVDAITPSDAANNQPVEVELSFAGTAFDLINYMLRVVGKGLMPYTVNPTALTTIRTDQSYLQDGNNAGLEVGDEVEGFLPVRLNQVAFLRSGTGMGQPSILVMGLDIAALEEAHGVQFIGCKLGDTSGLTQCTLSGCSVGYNTGALVGDGTDCYGCFLRAPNVQGTVRAFGGLLFFATVSSGSCLQLDGVASDQDTSVTLEPGAIVRAMSQYSLFGPGGVFSLGAGALLARAPFASIELASDPAVEWPNNAALSEVYDVDTTLPGGTPANPADNTWATYNGGTSDGNWIHWRTGARLTREIGGG